MPERIPVPLKLDEELLKWLKKEAKKQNRSLNNFIETVLFEKKNLKQ